MNYCNMIFYCSFFQIIFLKKNSKKSYYNNSFTESNDDSVQRNYATYNAGVTYDWDELRRRMEMGENSTVCTEDLSARAFAEAIGINCIYSSDEEEDTENDDSVNVTHSFYSSHTHRSIKSSGPALDMSMFIPPTEEEKKILFGKRETKLNNNNTMSSMASSTTQDYLDRLGNDLKRKVYDHSQSVSHRELSIFNSSNYLSNNFSENENMSMPIPHNDPIPTESIINEAHFNPTEIDQTSTPINKPSKINHYDINVDHKEKSNMTANTTTTTLNDLSNNVGKKDILITESKSISQSEIDLKMDHNRQSFMSGYSYEMMNKSRAEYSNDMKSCSQLEENHAKLISKKTSQKSEGIPSLERKSPSIASSKTHSTIVKSFKSEDSNVQEIQKGRFTVVKPIHPPNNGHRVFIVTKDEDDAYKTMLTSISSSPQKVALRKRSCSQPATFIPTETDRKVTKSYLKLSTSIPDNDECELNDQREYVLNPKKSNSVLANHSPYSNTGYGRDHHRSATTCATDYNRRKSVISASSFDYNSYEKDGMADSEDNLSEQFTLSRLDLKLEKEMNNSSSLYSYDFNKSYTSLHATSPPTSLSPPHSLSPLSRPYKPKNTNSRFQVTYGVGSKSPSHNSVCSKKSMESSKVNLNKISTRLLNDETNSLDEHTPKIGPYLVETETNDFANNSPILCSSYIDENKCGRPASIHSLALSNITTNTNIGSSNYLSQPINNTNQHTVCSISSVLTENGAHSNVSSPSQNGIKLSPYRNATKPLSVITTTSSVDMYNNDNNSHSDLHNLSHDNDNILQEKTNQETLSHSTPSHKILEKK